MRFSRTQAILLIAVLHFLVPILLILWNLVAPYGNFVDFAGRTLLLLSYSLFIYLVGTWAFAGFIARYVVGALAVGSVVVVLTTLRSFSPWLGQGIVFWFRAALVLAVFIGLAGLCAGALLARAAPRHAVQLSFPFADGVYAVFEGGNGQKSRLANYHYGSSVHTKSQVSNSMRYAVDVTKLSRWSNDADGIFPKQCERYPVFGEEVLAPCPGVVGRVSDGQPNTAPWSGSAPYNLGNYVLIRTESCHVLVGHLQSGTVRVAEGEAVKPGSPIARVGNSGWTSQPHLHIQAMEIDAANFWNGRGIPIAFENRTPFKNRLFKVTRSRFALNANGAHKNR